ncbi:hypothetical protein [Amycolatopsis sp. 195334CR]|uniref:DUF6973 domain-containing protein n=1 Tax=Amycolatopsis sp. 195334CR TaxID=2814588 RepID=UPI001A8D9FCC|nr:hypothetical protein [Amycolatopsis sp. 195334CR]MBN6040395.1 hypothetical protein [Amycolatopsis sp. 195334CR]
MGNAATGDAGAAPAPEAGGGQAPEPAAGQGSGGESADSAPQGEAKGDGAASADTKTSGAGGEPQASGSEQGGAQQGDEAQAPTAEGSTTGEPATGQARDAAGETGGERPGETATTGEEPRGEVAREVLTDVPPPDPKPVEEARDAWGPVVGKAEQARDHGRAGAKELAAGWNDDGGAAMAGRADASLREADELARGARPVTEQLDLTAGDYAHVRDQMVASAEHADGNARAADALAGSEPEARLAKAWFKESAVNRNLEVRAALDRKVHGDWENLSLPEQNLDNAQDALTQAGRDVIANLPAPPSDADLLRDYQVGDDQMIEVAGKTVSLSEAAASLQDDFTGINAVNPFFHWNIEDRATTAGQESFPDPDGPEGPQGGRTGTGDNHRDAFRHAYWNALMTRSFGEHSAEAVGTGHERRPDDPVPDTPPQFAERQEAMDLYNNQVGRDIATALGPGASDAEVRATIEQAIRDGKLVVLNQDKTALVPGGGTEDFP